MRLLYQFHIKDKAGVQGNEIVSATSYAKGIELVLLVILIFSMTVSSSYAQQRQFPYYASIKADEANIRTGPSVKYPIEWVYKKSNWPVKVTATFERWRKLEDVYGEVGWVHESLLTGKRNAIIKTKGGSVQEVYRLPVLTSPIVFIAEDGVVVEISSCKNNWCKVETRDGHKGWVKSEQLWGVKDGEIIG